MQKKEKLVFPGDFLTVAEEFVAGNNTLEDENGNVLASAVGIADFNEDEREVSVEKKGKQALPLDKGSIVYGTIYLVKDSIAIVEIFKAEKDGNARIFNESRAMIGVSNVSTEYVRKMADVFRIGDIVKAEVVKLDSFAIDLGTSNPVLGVIKAFCSKCRNPLHLSGSQLKCIKCSNVERRKTSTEYVLK